jgi:hypothetical protein
VTDGIGRRTISPAISIAAAADGAPGKVGCRKARPDNGNCGQNCKDTKKHAISHLP